MKKLIALASISLLFFLLFSGGPDAQANPQTLVDSAVGYLESRQNADGSWGDRSALRDTVEVIAALHQSRPQSTVIPLALSWLSVEQTKNDDMRAQRAALLTQMGQDASVDLNILLGKIRKNHGWGITDDYESDLLTTLKVLQALGNSPLLNYQTKSSVLEWVLSQQREDGSFGYTDGNESSIFLTAETVRTLSQITSDVQTDESISRGGHYLLTKLNSNGSLGTGLYENLIAADALRRTKVITSVVRDNLYSYIATRQNADGSFGSSAYDTALAVKLFGGSRANLALDQSSIKLSNPRPGPGETITISATIHNYGDLTAENVLVQFRSCDENAALGGLIGEATVPRIDALSSAEVSIQYLTSTNAGVFNLCVVIDGNDAIAELNERDNSYNIEIQVNDGAPPTISGLQVDNQFISPNGDGVQDSATLSYRLSEDARISLLVRSEEGFIETVVKGKIQSGGANTLVWDGQGEEAPRLGDGRYTLILAATDSAGNTARSSIQVTLDNNQLLYRYMNQVREIVGKIGTVFATLDLTLDGRYLVSQDYFGLQSWIHDFDSRTTRAIPDNGTQQGLQIGVLPHREAIVKTWYQPPDFFSPRGMRILDLETTDELIRLPMSDYKFYSEVVASPDERLLYALGHAGSGILAESPILEYNTETGESKTLFTFTDTILTSIFLSKDGQRLYCVGRRAVAQMRLYEYDLKREELSAFDISFDPAVSELSLTPTSSGTYYPRLMRGQVGNYIFFTSVIGKSYFNAIYRLHAYDLAKHQLIDIAQTPGISYEMSDDVLFSKVTFVPQDTAQGIYYAEIHSTTFNARPLYLVFPNNLYLYNPDTKVRKSIAENLPDGSMHIDPRNGRALLSTNASYGLWAVDLSSGELSQAVSYVDLMPTELFWRYGQIEVATPDGKRIYFGPPVDFPYNGSFYQSWTQDIWRFEFSADPESQERFVRIEDVTRPLEDRRQACFSGLAMDANFSSWRLEYLSLDHPLDGWRVLTTSSLEASDGQLGCFDTTGMPSGLLVIRLVVTDRAGNIMVYGAENTGALVEYYKEYGTIPENLPGKTFLFYNESIPSAFVALPSTKHFYLSPNGDGNYDSLHLNYGLKGLARISAWITDANGVVVADLVSGSLQGVGTYTIGWAGTSADGQKLSDGDYILHLRDDYVVEKPETVSFSVKIDTIVPEVALQDPADQATLSGIVALTGNVSDANLLAFSIKVKPHEEPGWRTLSTTNSQSGVGILMHWDTTELNGDYDLQIAAIDKASNTSSMAYHFTVDNTPPSVTLLEPVSGAIVFGSTKISATSADRDLASVRLSVKLDGAASWTTLAVDVNPPYETIWDSTSPAFPHGTYLVRAVAVDLAGNASVPSQFNVLLDKKEPSSSIVSPLAASVLRGTVAVGIETPDADIADIGCLIRPALGSAFNRFAVDSSAPYIVSLNTTLYADGVYYLASQARDRSDLTEGGLRPISITVDNTLPTISITSPSSDQSVGGTVGVVGLFADQHPQSYTLSCRGPLPSTNATEFASGNGAASGTIGLLETSSLINGDYMIVLTGRDQAGNTATAEQRIRVANITPEILAFSLGSKFVSPNGDGVQDVVTVSYTTSSEARVTLEARDRSGSSIALVADHIPQAAGTHELLWDVRGSGGHILTDATYSLVLKAADEFGNEATRIESLEVDSTSPVVSIDSPLPSTRLCGAVSILGAIDEKNFMNYRVLVAQDVTGAQFLQVYSGTPPPLDKYLATWDSTGKIGYYLVRVEASDKAGNKGSAMVNVSLVDPAPAISVLPLSQRYYSSGMVTLSAVTTRPGIVNVTVVDDANRTVKSVAVNRVLETGITELQWDLNDSSGQKVIDGQYGFVVSFLDDITQLISRLQSESVIIDSLEPNITITAPANGATLSASSAVQGTIDERNFGNYSVSYGIVSVPIVWRQLMSSSERPATASLHFWNISSLSGLYHLKVEAVDLAGNHASRMITVNATPLGTAVIADPVLSELAFSPNGDGVKDQTVLSFSLLQSSRLTVWMENYDGISMVSLATDIAESTGLVTLPWDGKDFDGALVPDGTYSWFVRVVLPDGTEHVHPAGQCIVDTVVPTVKITSPTVGATLIDKVEIRGTIVEPIFNTFEVSQRAVGATTSASLGIFRNPPVSELLAHWDIGGISGSYELVFAATDRAGNRSDQIIPVTVVDGRIPFLSGVNVSTPLISPNGDGYLDTVNVTFTVSRQMSVEATVRNASGTQVRLLQASSLRTAGNYTTAWDGRAGDGTLVEDGQYSLEIVANDTLSGRSERAVALVTLDRTAPLIAVESPAVGTIIGQTLSVVGSVTEARLRQVTVYVDSGNGYAVIEPVTMTGNRFCATTKLQISEGQVSIRVVAQDQGGLIAEHSFTVSLDAVPPTISLGFTSQASAVSTVALRSPASESLGVFSQGKISSVQYSSGAQDVEGALGVQEPSFVKGIAAINFSAVDTHFKEAMVQYGSPSYWNTICRVTVSTPNSTCNWDTRYLFGQWQVRITAQDLSGNNAELVVPVIVDNEPPTATLSEPIATTVYTDTLTVRGKVYDYYILKFLVEYRKSVDGEPWELLYEGHENFSGQMAKVTHVEPIDGPIEVHLKAVDRAGSTKEQFVRSYMDNIKPPAPTGVAAVIGLAGRPIVSWDPVPVGDLKEYRVYRDLAFLSTVTNATSLTDSVAADGRHRYTVTATDLHGNEGAKSEVAEVTVDLTPPLVHISSPTSEKSFGGVIAIRGSAYAEDLAWYRIEVGRDPLLTGWELVHYSTLPKRDEVLGYWSSFPAQGNYTIRLAAEDVRHNSTSILASFSVDNGPPASPSGFVSQVVDGSTFKLSWNPNSESDLAGYRILLYGNAVQPGLLPVAEYTTVNMPDGLYRYTVVAIDNAGNTSQPSDTAVIDLDNRPPALAVIQPANGASVRDPNMPLSVIARSVDYDVILAEFQYRPVADPTWTKIGTVVTEIFGTGQNPMTLGDIGMDWSVGSLAEGDYRVRVVGTDRHARVDPAPMEAVIHFRNPPARPSGLVARLNGCLVTLSWTANTEPDLAGYRVYRDGQIVNNVSTTGFSEIVATENVHRYAVTAFDSQGDESDPCADVTVRIDTTAPNLAITSPVQGQKIGQSLTVTGTASETPLGQFLVDYSLNGGVSWNVIKMYDQAPASPFSVSWMTGGLNAPALLRVSARDGAGNHGVSPVVSVVIDNTAPAVPSALTAVANADGTVGVSWNVVNDLDLIGYAVYLKNDGESDYTKVSTSVITGTSFDIRDGLEPGTLVCITVAALDDVENRSNLALTACITPRYSLDPVTPRICSPYNGYSTPNSQVDIHGYAPPYSRVILLRDGVAVDSIIAPEMSTSRTEYTPNLGTGVLRRSPDGRWIVYKNSSQFSDLQFKQLKNLPWNPSQFQDFTYDSAAAIFTDGYKLERYELATNVVKEILALSGGRMIVKLWVSPASHWLACLIWTGVNYEIQLIDGRNGTSVLAESGLATIPSVAWHYDATHFFFTRGAELVRYQIGSGTRTSFSFNQTCDEFWSGSGDDDLFYRVGSTLWYTNLATGSVTFTELPEWFFEATYVPWAPGFLVSHININNFLYMFAYIGFDDGHFLEPYSLWETKRYATYYGGGIGTNGLGEGLHYVCTSNQCNYRFFSFPGRFTFPDAGLAREVTLFSALDENVTGDRSNVSLPVSVIKAPSTVKPGDIFVDTVVHEPSDPTINDTVEIHVHVTNNASKLFRNLLVSGRVTDAKGTTLSLGAQNVLHFFPLSSQDFSFLWTPTVPGAYQYTIEITPSDSFDADVTENNVVSVTVRVRISDISGNLIVQQGSHLPGELLAGELAFTNHDTASHSVAYTLQLQNMDGLKLLTIAESTLELPPEGEAAVTINWAIPELAPGLYRLRLSASEVGSELFEQVQYMEILSNGSLNSALFVENANLRCGEIAQLLARIGNPSTNTIYEGVRLVLQLLGPDGKEVFGAQRALSSIFPYGMASELFEYTQGTCVPGSYRAILSVFESGQLIEGKSVSFDISQPPPVLELTGSLTIAPRRLARGMDLMMSYEIRNSSLVAAVDQLARIDILDSVSGLPIGGYDLLLNCAPGDVATGQVTNQDVQSPEGFYPVLLSTTIDGAVRLIDQGGFEIGDVVAPNVAILEPQLGSAHPRSRLLSISSRVTDSLSGVSLAEYRIVGQTDWSLLAYQSGNANDGIYTASLDASSWVDGEYILEVRAIDRDGNNWNTQIADPNPSLVTFNLINLATMNSATTVVPRVLVYAEKGDDCEESSESEGGGSANPYYDVALSGIKHLIVDELDDFVREMESGSYNIFIINGSLAENLNANPTSEESAMLVKLRERAYAGAGVVLSRWMRYQDDIELPILAELTGNSKYVRSRNSDMTLVGLASGYDYLEGVATNGRSIVFAPDRSSVVASIYDSKARKTYPAITIAPYGSGKCVFVGFNLDKSYYRQAKQAIRELVIALAGATTPEQEFAYPGGTMPIRIDVQAFSDVSLKVEEKIPTGVEIIDVGGGTVSNSTLTWGLSLPSGATTGITYIVRLPETGVSVGFAPSLFYLDGAEYRLIAQYPWSLSYGFTLPGELWEIETLVQSLGLSTHTMGQVSALFGELAGNPRSTCAQKRHSVNDTLEVISLIKDRPEGGVARHRLDRLLFYYQRRVCHFQGEE